MIFQDGRLQAGFHRGGLRFMVLFQNLITNSHALVADVYMPRLVGGI
jgi:hypothetical protein